jgi:hypothetical protein
LKKTTSPARTASPPCGDGQAWIDTVTLAEAGG